jgi:hypothetical protein
LLLKLDIYVTSLCAVYADSVQIQTMLSTLYCDFLADPSLCTSIRDGLSYGQIETRNVKLGS